jgi:hypothetical protein
MYRVHHERGRLLFLSHLRGGEGRRVLVIQVARQHAIAFTVDISARASADVHRMKTGVTDRLRALGYGGIIVPLVAARRATNSVEYPHLRDEMWFACAEWIREGGCIPDDPELISELAAPTYKFDAQGRRQVESKDEMKKRGLSSPDKADALVMTFAQPVAIPDERDKVPGARPRNVAEHEYDPFQR